MKKTILSIVFALVTGVAFVCAVMAQQQSAPAATASAPAKLEKFSGVIEKLDEAKKEVIVKAGNNEMTFSWGDQTKFMQGKKEVFCADLKKGEHVTVQYKKEGEKLTAEKVKVSKPKTVSKKPPSEKATETKQSGNQSRREKAHFYWCAFFY